jgi:hypothetical protein
MAAIRLFRVYTSFLVDHQLRKTSGDNLILSRFRSSRRPTFDDGVVVRQVSVKGFGAQS